MLISLHSRTLQHWHHSPLLHCVNNKHCNKCQVIKMCSAADWSMNMNGIWQTHHKETNRLSSSFICRNIKGIVTREWVCWEHTGNKDMMYSATGTDVFFSPVDNFSKGGRVMEKWSKISCSYILGWWRKMSRLSVSGISDKSGAYGETDWLGSCLKT